jgi:ATP-dependent protease HslVU (ClpYQ) peptidase subunit
LTTVVVVRKAGQVAIAADTLVTFGDTRLSHRYEANSKLFKVDTSGGPSWVGMAGTVAHFPRAAQGHERAAEGSTAAGQSRRGVRYLCQACIRC